MELTKYCKWCKCSTCRWQGTDNCFHDRESRCFRCDGRKEFTKIWKQKSYECRGYEKKAEVNHG